MKKFLFIVIALVILSCKNDDSIDETDKLDITLVTGITIRETADQVPLKLGNPNVFTNNLFTVFPNPASNVINIFCQNTITDVYFLPATAQKIHQNVDYSTLNNSALYQESTLSSLASLKLNNQTEAILNIDITGLETGYYRIFIKTQELLFWDNFYKLDSQIDGDNQIDALIEFWN